MYTEEEAKKKWCPLNAIVATMAMIDAKKEILQNQLHLFHCKASPCMMWIEKESQGRCGLIK